MMTSQILKFVDFTKIQKSRYLENGTLFLLQIKKIKSITFKVNKHDSAINKKLSFK